MAISKHLFRTIVLGITLLRVSASGAQGMPEFEVEGVMHLNSSLAPRSARVQVWVRGCQWAVRHIQEAKFQGKDVVLWITETSDNGTNIHVLRHLQDKARGSLSYDPARAITNSWSAQIHPSGFPRWIEEPEIACLFYAYASSCYLDSVTNNLLEPIRFFPGDFFYQERLRPASFTRVSGSQGVPVQICFLDDTGVATNAVLTSSNFTLGPGFQIPLRVVLTRYDGRREPLVICDFEAASVKPGSAAVSFNPELQPQTCVSDYRFYHGDPPFHESEVYGMVIHYGLLDHWPTEAEAEVYNRNVVLPGWEPDSLQKLRPYYDSLQRGMVRDSIPKWDQPSQH